MNGSHSYYYYEALLLHILENELSTNIANSFHLDTDSHAQDINKKYKRKKKQTLTVINKCKVKYDSLAILISMPTKKHTRIRTIIYVLTD